MVHPWVVIIMTREFIMTITFDRLWNKFGFTDDELLSLQLTLLTNPKAGDIIKGTGGARKIRFSFYGSGKSGGIRVIYIDLTAKNQLYLILCYSKGIQDDLSAEQRKQVKELIHTLKGLM